MSDIYTGWDGKTYPWPPPDGWYEASDGRWWAAGTGPSPPPSAVGPDPAGARSERTGPAAETSQFELGPDSSPILGQQQRGPGDLGPPGWDPGPSESASRGGGRIAAVLLALVAVVAGGAAVAYFVFDIGRTDDPDGLAATEASDDSVSTSSETDEATDASDTATGELTDSTDPEADADSATGGSSAGTTSSLPTETTDSSEGTTPETSAPVDVEAATATFKEILAQNDLPAVLTDEQISNVGTSSCELASVSTDATQFETIVRQAIEEAGSTLAPDELMLVTTAAVVSFCPDEADRLGLSL